MQGRVFLLFWSPPVGQNKEDQRRPLLVQLVGGHTSGASQSNSARLAMSESCIYF